MNNQSDHTRHTAILCRDLTRHYGEIKAVEGLNLEVQAGSVFGFLGRNGAGKTTTIRMLTGLTQPTRGDGWIAGIKATSADSPARYQFGYLPQSPAFYPWMTPFEYLSLCAQLYEVPQNSINDSVGSVLALVDLQQAARRKIGGFSGGMLQRMGIAQALVHNPPILFLDEPTSALDPAGRYEILDLIKRLHGEVTIFLSSHILTDIERVCDTVGILRSGKLVTVAKREELMNQYTVQTAAIFFEYGQSPPDSFVEDLNRQSWCQEVSQTEDGLRIAVDQREIARPALQNLIAQYNLPIERYEWVRPTLEEIFLKLSE